jgi:hypothetical protein
MIYPYELNIATETLTGSAVAVLVTTLIVDVW